LANLFCKHIFHIHGLPDKIILDQGSTFVSKFWQALMVSLNIKSALSTAYHPQTDGQTERTNQTLEDYLRHFCSYYQDNWDKCLDMAEFALNNLDSTSLKISPFFFCYGHHPKLNILTENMGRPGLDEFVTDLQLTQERAMECLVQARRLQAHYYNKGRQDLLVFEKGEEVLLLRKFIQSRINSKLDYRYLGPFRVDQMVGANAVRLEIGKDYPRLHPVFNLSLVVKYFGPNSILQQGTQEGIKNKYYEDKDVVDWSKLNQVLDVRKYRKNKYEYLLLWQNSTVANDTWVSQDHIPERLTGYLTHFGTLHEEIYNKQQGKKKRKTTTNGEKE
jgi:hypothetical protein